MLAVLAAGCGTTGEERADVSDSRSMTVLERQREEVRSVAADLVRRAVDALHGRPSLAAGRFLGCESASESAYATFRYTATARVDAGDDTPRPYLEVLRAALMEAGFDEPTTTRRPGGTTLLATRAGLSASFAELPAAGDHVLLRVDGPCVEVPEQGRDAYLERTDPEPYA